MSVGPQAMSGWTRAHRRSILFLMAMLALAGVIAAWQLPVSLFPAIEFPRAVVELDAGDQPAEQMEITVTRPVEEALRRVPGVRGVRSATSRGAAEISINFDWGTDMTSAALQVNAAIAQVNGRLPPGVQASTRRMDTTVFPIIAYSLVSQRLSPVQLRDLAEYQLKPLLSGVDGVAGAQVIGGALAEIRVSVDPAKLRAHDLALADVAAALAGANVLGAVGRLEDHYKLYLIVANGAAKDLAQLRGLALRNPALADAAHGVVRLGEVAEVEQATEPQWTRVTADGRDAVLLSVYQQPGSNSVRIAGDIKARLAAYRSQLPPGVTLANWYDQSELVISSATSVRDAVLIGVVLSALVLLVFLRNVKVTLIAMTVVPAVLAVTVLLLSVLGMSFNIMTLGGMAAAVGLIIDDAIVMIEHILRRLQGRAADHETVSARVAHAALEFSRPLAGSSASTLIIFAPLAFLSGVTGAFFKALSLTMAAALLISFLMTWLAVPLLAGRFLTLKDAVHHPDSRFLAGLKRRYARTLTALLARPAMLLLGVVPLLLAGGLAFRAVGSGFMPAMDEGGFVFDYRSPPGTALAETDRLLRQVERIIQSTPDVETYSRRTGTGLGGGLSEANQGDLFIRLKRSGRRPVEEVMNEVRQRVEQQVPGLRVEMAQLMEDLIGDLTAVPQPVEIKIYLDDAATLSKTALDIAARLEKIPGVVDVANGVNPAGDALDVRIDASKAALEGMDADGVRRALADALGGNVAARIPSGVKMIGIRVWLPLAQRATDTQVAELAIRAPDGHQFPLRRVATITAVSGQPQIARDNLKRMVAVTARISGSDLGSVIAEVRRMMAQPGLLPPGAYFALGGLYEQQQIAFKGLLTVFAAAAALVFLLLLFLYESFRIALAILVTALLAVSAVFIGLWVSGIELNISAMMGMTMIIGMVTEVAIFYCSERQELALADTQASPAEVLVQAGLNRMRPIAMTTLAAILTLLPLAFALGEGAQMQQPLAIAIISGLVVQLPLVLLLMPALLHLTRPRPDPTSTIHPAHPSQKASS